MSQAELLETGAEPTDVMIDLETLGKAPFSPILSIGACAFRFDDVPVADTFYQAIDIESCLKLGMKPDADTLKWWLQQDVDARGAAFFDVEQVSLPLALDAFTDWLASRPMKLWGNSARFDLGLLEAAYKVCGKEVPWEFWNERCYRTVKNLPGAKAVQLTRFGVHHNALDDAIAQVAHLRDLYRALGLSEETNAAVAA